MGDCEVSGVWRLYWYCVAAIPFAKILGETGDDNAVRRVAVRCLGVKFVGEFFIESGEIYG